MDIRIERIDHWGIVSGVIKDLELVKLVNEQIGTDNREILTTGDIVAGMIINGLGFASRPLMLTPQFFENKALALLIKPDIKPEHFNRHRIGRAFDAISEFGCEKLFNFLALSACAIEKVETKFGHADTTSYSLEGEYNSEELDENGKPIEQKINITYGYSKANRPDLKQVIQELVTSNDGGIPFITKTLSGNVSDVTTLRERVTAVMNDFSKSTSRCFVADCKLYVENTADILNKINFITRAPSSLNLVKEYIQKSIDSDSSWIDLENGYKYQEFSVDKYNIEDQRWIVYYSKQAHERSQKTLTINLEKEKENIEQQLSKLQKIQFGCEDDALKNINNMSKKWKYYEIESSKTTSIKLYTGRGRPAENNTKYKIVYEVTASIVLNKKEYQSILDQQSCFVLATNRPKTISAKDILNGYKGQDYTEKGFAFLKKPEFFTSSLNLEKPGRIEAVLMIMVLSLLVYSLAQRRLRIALKEKDETIPDQLKKPTKNPTMRWVFQLFEGINFVIMKVNGISKTLIEGLNDVRLQIIKLLGKNVLNIYQNFSMST